MTVTVDTSRVERMLEELASKSLDRVVEQEARKAAASVTGIPVRTGRLAASPRVEAYGETARVVSDVEYAGYVFHGTRHMEAQPPTVNYTAADLADAVAKELFS